jgi:hypothetical protein
MSDAEAVVGRAELLILVRSIAMVAVLGFCSGQNSGRQRRY